MGAAPVCIRAALALLLFSCHQCHEAPWRVIGRHRRNDDGSFDFDHPGVTITVRFTGSQRISALMSKVGILPVAFVVYCDGMIQMGPADLPLATFSTDGWRVGVAHLVPLCDGLDPKSEHEVSILKSSEALWNSIRPLPNHVSFHKLVGSHHGVRMLAAPKRQRRKLEFLGDSITAGFCNLCGVLKSSCENFALTWTKLVCQAFGAECHVAAWSGFGMVRNCCGGETLMSDIWLRTLASTPSGNASDPHGTSAENRWPFELWKPDALIINLGTNDNLSLLNISLTADYNRTYLGLVKSAAAAYGPETQFFLACGPMKDSYCNQVHWVIEQAKAAGIKADFLDQRGFACISYGHPNAEAHRAMASATITRLKDVLDWSDEFVA